MQVLKYQPGQKYDAHHDVGSSPPRAARSSPPTGATESLTVLLYLSDVEEGGETAFPDSEWLDPTAGDRNEPVERVRDHVAVKP